jgi:hypothetical protein
MMYRIPLMSSESPGTMDGIPKLQLSGKPSVPEAPME